MLQRTMPTCAKCHRDVVAGSLFCGACGAPIVPEPGEAPDPYIGQTVKDTYFIQRRVGGGGMGDVYKAVHMTLDKPVALKLLKKSLLADPALVERFYREARSASKLQHPNVINVTDFGQTEDGTLFMVMEYLAGKDLARVIAEERPLSERRIVHLGAQVLAALAEAHAAGILHRDMKPENVMIESRRDEPDSVKVLDFGIAKIQRAEGDDDTGQPALTKAGLVCGTPGYMSPEQWGGAALDARSDLYAVGVLLYAMLTGKLPIEASTPMELVRKQLTEPPQPPSARRPGGVVSEDLERLVMRALSPDPASRPASAEEMRSELLACALLADPEPVGGTQSTGKAGDAGDADQTMALHRPPGRRTPGPTPAPDQGPRARTPPGLATRPALSRPQQRPTSTPAAPPMEAGSAREMNGPVAEPIGRPPIAPIRLGSMVRVGAGVGVFALAIGLYVWKGEGRSTDSIARRLPTFGSAPGPTPAPTAAPTPVPTAAPTPLPPSPDELPPTETPGGEPTPTPRATASPVPARPGPEILPPATPKPTLAAPRPKARLVLTSKMSGRVFAAVGALRLELALNVPRPLEIPAGTTRVSFALLGTPAGTCAVALDISEGQKVGLVFGPESGFVTRLGSGAEARTKIECR
jgi:serine/threonine protein kinase